MSESTSQQWEYRQEWQTRFAGAGILSLDEELNALGRNGWEIYETLKRQVSLENGCYEVSFLMRRRVERPDE